MQKLQVKTMLTAIVYAKVIIHHKFVLEKQIVNGKFYEEVIKRLISQVHCVRPEFQEGRSRYLLQNNALAHIPGVVSRVFGETRDPLYPITLLP
jgi:hypothetical protein